jgi:hypothetical protein
MDDQKMYHCRVQNQFSSTSQTLTQPEYILRTVNYRNLGSKQALAPEMVSQAGLKRLYGYFRITGLTGVWAKKAPVLKGSKCSPFVVVPSVHQGKLQHQHLVPQH